SQIRDYVGVGTITYYWAGKEVKGEATIRGRGTAQFRLDAKVAGGVRSWAVSNDFGQVKEIDGTISQIPYHNAIGLRALTFPGLRMMEAALGHNLTISAKTIAMRGGKFHEVAVQPQLPDNKLSHLAAMNYFIDPNTFAIVAVHNQTHPNETMTRDIPHAVYYSDFRVVNGSLVPFSIAETLDTNRTWSLQLNSVTFNTGLTDADIRLVVLIVTLCMILPSAHSQNYLPLRGFPHSLQPCR